MDVPRQTRRASAKKVARKKPVKKAPARTAASRIDGDLEELIAGLEHPLKDAVVDVVALMVASDAAVCAGIKWNSPSFRTDDYFATVNLHAKDKLRLILHRGAKVKRDRTAPKIADPKKLLEWLGPDRAMVVLRSRADVTAKRAALTRVVRAWVGTL